MPVKTEIQYRLWNNTDFPSISPEYTQRGLNSSMYCPASNNYKIAGNYLAKKNYQYVSVNIYRWLGINWKSQDEINSYLRKIVVSFGILGSYMDINDYENPIKYFFDDINMYFINPDFTKEIKIYLKLSEANMDDDYLGISSPTTKQFFDVERSREDLQSSASDFAVTVVYQTLKFNLNFLIIFIKSKFI